MPHYFTEVYKRLSGFPYGIKIFMTILFYLAALSLFGTMLSRKCEDTVLYPQCRGRDRLADIHFIYGLVFFSLIY